MGDVSYTLHALGMTYYKNQDIITSTNYLLESLRVRKLNLGSNNRYNSYYQHPLIAESLYCLGLVYQYQADYDVAERYFMEALRIYESNNNSNGNNNNNIANVFIHLASIYENIENNNNNHNNSSLQDNNTLIISSYQKKVV